MRRHGLILVGLLAGLLWASPAWAVLAADAFLEIAYGAPGNNTGPNVSASATVLVATVLCADTGGTTPISSVSATWDQGGTNQVMTQFGSQFTSNANGTNATALVFRRLAPTAGANLLNVNWSGGVSVICYVGMKSYTGGDSTTPLGNLSTAAETTLAAVTVTQSPAAPAGDMIQSASTYSGGVDIVSATDNNSGTSDYLTHGGCCGSAGRTSGSGSTAFTYTYASAASNIVAVSFDVCAPSGCSGAVAPVPHRSKGPF